MRRATMVRRWAFRQLISWSLRRRIKRTTKRRELAGRQANDRFTEVCPNTIVAGYLFRQQEGVAYRLAARTYEDKQGQPPNKGWKTLRECCNLWSAFEDTIKGPTYRAKERSVMACFWRASKRETNNYPHDHRKCKRPTRTKKEWCLTSLLLKTYNMRAREQSLEWLSPHPIQLLTSE